MRCIFCKNYSAGSKSVEHIVPESLGNTEHILAAGIVCDSCNNYFARKIEEPVLNGKYFSNARFRNVVPNKKGRIPTIEGIQLPTRTILEISREADETRIYPKSEKDAVIFTNYVSNNAKGRLYIPHELMHEKDCRLMSRFIGKIAIEALTQRVSKVEGGIEEIIITEQLDELREYVRWNKGKDWPYSQRKIYAEDLVYSEGDLQYEVLHEFTFLRPPNNEIFFVIAIFGVEYAINLGGPDISNYETWLAKNKFRSPLL